MSWTGTGFESTYDATTPALIIRNIYQRDFDDDLITALKDDGCLTVTPENEACLGGETASFPDIRGETVEAKDGADFLRKRPEGEGNRHDFAEVETASGRKFFFWR